MKQFFFHSENICILSTESIYVFCMIFGTNSVAFAL